MGRFKGNDAARGLAGDVGDFYSYRQYLGKTVVTRQVGKRVLPLSEKQKEIVKRFKKAVTYAKAIAQNPDKLAIYQEKVSPGKGAYVLAVTDYLNVPVVDIIETAAYTGEVGSLIIAQAMDDFMVIRVKIVIYNEAGDLLEEGDAVLDADNGLDYVYTATVVNDLLAGTRIVATAYDLAGNAGSLEMII